MPVSSEIHCSKLKVPCITYSIGVDIGTGSARVCLIDNDGNLIETASQEIQTWQSQPGCYEQSTTDIWRKVSGAIRNVLTVSKVCTDSITAIVFGATCSLAMFDAQTHDPVSASVSEDAIDHHNIILWMHKAAVEEAKLITATQHQPVQYLGGSISPFMALAKVLWLKNNMSKERFENCRFFDLQDALSFIATDRFETQCDSHCAKIVGSGFGIDGTIKGWNPSFLHAIHLDCLTDTKTKRIGGLCSAGHVPSIGTPVGKLSDRAALDLGLPSNVLVGTGVVDCYAGWVGTVGIPMTPSLPGTETLATERIAIVAGTSACHIIASDTSHLVKGLWGPYEDFLLPRTYTMAGGQPAVGRLLQHIVETHPAYCDVRSQAESQGLTIFDYLNNHLHDMQTSKKAPNLTYLGRHTFFYGDYFGNRAPIADAEMTGSIVGLTGNTDIDNLAIMYYCALEFLALQTRHIITTMVDGGHRVSAIFMSGSVCQNAVFTQLLATVCSLPVIIPRYPRAAVCYGSAVLAAHTQAIACGGPVDGLWSTMTRMSKPGSVIVPDDDQYARDLLDVKYTILLEQAERQRVFRNMIDSVAQK